MMPNSCSALTVSSLTAPMNASYFDNHLIAFNSQVVCPSLSHAQGTLDTFTSVSSLLTDVIAKACVNVTSQMCM